MNEHRASDVSECCHRCVSDRDTDCVLRVVESKVWSLSGWAAVLAKSGKGILRVTKGLGEEPHILFSCDKDKSN